MPLDDTDEGAAASATSRANTVAGGSRPHTITVHTQLRLRRRTFSYDAPPPGTAAPVLAAARRERLRRLQAYIAQHLGIPVERQQFYRALRAGGREPLSAQDLDAMDEEPKAELYVVDARGRTNNLDKGGRTKT